MYSLRSSRSYFPKTCSSSWDVFTCWNWVDHWVICSSIHVSKIVALYNDLYISRGTFCDLMFCQGGDLRHASQHKTSFCSRQCWNKSSYLHLHHFNLELCRRHHPSEYRRWRKLQCWKNFTVVTIPKSSCFKKYTSSRILLHSWFCPVILNRCGCL